MKVLQDDVDAKPKDPAEQESEPGQIYVCSLAELSAKAEALQPSHVVSLVPGFEQPSTPARVRPENHLRLELDDIEEPFEDLILPEVHHIQQLIDFADWWQGDRPMLIHCAAGVSRSTAAALVALCRRTSLAEDELVAELRRVAPHAAPNRRIIQLADALLKRENRLLEAVDALAKVEKIAQGPLVCLTASLLPCDGSRQQAARPASSGAVR